MLSLVTPDNLAAVLTAIGAILSGIGGWTLWKAKKEPAPPGTIDATREALAENTAAINGMVGQFADNNRLFTEILTEVRSMGDDIRSAREHLNAIRDGVNRR